MITAIFCFFFLQSRDRLPETSCVLSVVLAANTWDPQLYNPTMGLLWPFINCKIPWTMP